MLVQVFDGAAYVARRRSAPNDPAWREHSAGAGVAQPAGHGSSGDDDQRRGCGILDALAEDVDQYRHGEDRSRPPEESDGDADRQTERDGEQHA